MSETAVCSEIKDPLSWVITFFAIGSLHFMISYWSGIADVIAYFCDVTKIQHYLKRDFIGANFVYRHRKIGFNSDDYTVCWKLKGQSRWIKFHWHRMLRTAWQIHQFWYDDVLNLISVIVYVGIIFYFAQCLTCERTADELSWFYRQNPNGFGSLCLRHKVERRANDKFNDVLFDFVKCLPFSFFLFPSIFSIELSLRLFIGLFGIAIVIDIFFLLLCSICAQNILSSTGSLFVVSRYTISKYRISYRLNFHNKQYCVRHK